MMIRLFVMVVMVLAACAAPQPANGPDIPDEVARASIVVLGELHGTREAPAAAVDLVEALARPGRPVALAIELPAVLDPQLQRYLESDGSPVARAELLANPHWTRSRRYQDGRASEAMAALIERMRRIRKSGKPVRLVAFVPAGFKSPVEYERGMAAGILSQRHEGETMVVLVGNVHAVKHGDEARFPAREKMASFLPPEAISIVMRDRGGSAWVCTPKCGPSEGPGSYDDAALDGHIVMQRGNGYDGVFYVGRVTASEPAAAVD